MFNDVEILLGIFPSEIKDQVEDAKSLLEIALDLGKPVELRYTGNRYKVLDVILTKEMLNSILTSIGEFGPDNRAGLDNTLHRISRIINRHEETIGLTCRIGKPFSGSIDIIKEFLDEGHNVLLLGKPASGKTTKLRDAARYLSVDCHKRVVVIDTSNEIAGDGDVSHSAIGRSRRLQVPISKSQHEVMIEAVENHTPEVIIIDEISTIQEAYAANTIAQRAVQLIATAHGNVIGDIMDNPPLDALVGGIVNSTLSDQVVKERGLTTKNIKERKNNPVFDVIIELVDFDIIRVHKDVSLSVDVILSGGSIVPEERRILNDKVVVTIPEKIKRKDTTGSTIESRAKKTELKTSPPRFRKARR